jgi:hypothetical protein
MTIDTMPYFQTIDVEKRVGEACHDAKGLLWAVNRLYDMLGDTEYADRLNALGAALEGSDGLMDEIWSEIIARQAEIEEEEIQEERAAQREEELAMV